jgi:phosphoglycerate dehydrogenase-like enzyme
MRVIGTQREPKPVPHVEHVFGGPEGTERVLRESDYLVVLLPLTPETRGSIGARELDWMKPTAYLVNLARGGIVDERALLGQLRAGSWPARRSTCSRTSRCPRAIRSGPRPTRS